MSISIRCWLRRISLRPQRPCPEVIEGATVLGNAMTSFSTVEDPEKKDSSMSVQEESQSIRQALTFQTLPIEIRHIIYSFILPQQRRLIHLTRENYPAPTWKTLRLTCKHMLFDVTRWFRGIKNYPQRFLDTRQHGLIDESNTHFVLTVDDAFRDREICKVDDSQVEAWVRICKCCKKFENALHPIDWKMITSLAIQFKTEDAPGRRDNLNAIKALTKLTNLHSLNILLGDVGCRWNHGRELWHRHVPVDGHFWIPICEGSFVALVPLNDEPLRFVITVWIVVLGADRQDRVELLFSYNKEAGKGRSAFPIADLCSAVEWHSALTENDA